MAISRLSAHDLIEVLCAAHLSHHVESPFEERGGIMIVGAPGVLKSTFTAVLDNQYSDAIMVSDLNAKSLVQLRDAIATGRVRTLVLPELNKLYERHIYTAANVEGTIRAMAAEGFAGASFEDSRVNRMRARAFVVGALTPKVQNDHFTDWEETGFNRRFLWSLIKLDNPLLLESAVVEWQRIDFRVKHVPRPPLDGERIPNLTTRDERLELQRIVKYQPGGSQSQQLQLITKILAVLKWWYEETADPRAAMDVVRSFGATLGKEGAALVLDRPPRIRRSEKAVAKRAATTLAKARWQKGRPVKKAAKRRK